MIASLVAGWAERFPEQPAAIDASESLSWNELLARSERYARELRALGIGRGQAIVLHLPARADSLALVAACDHEGVHATLVSTTYPAARALAAAKSSGARAVVGLDGHALVSTHVPSDGAPSTSAEPIVGVLTSGTTAEPKCAEHTWRSIMATVKPSARREEKRWLLAYPLSHIAALSVVAQCLVNRGTLVMPRDFSPESVAEATAAHRVQCMSSTPTFLRQLLHRAPESFWRGCSVEQFILGGEIVDARLLAALRELVPAAKITHIYATTELGTVLVVEDGREGFDSALLDGESLRLVDGELQVRRRAGSMRRYAGQTEVLGAADWWPTGDLVDVKEGRALFRGRHTDIINVGGFKVAPAEVEAVLRGIAGIRAVSIVAHPSSLAGNLVKAIIETAPGHDPATVRRDTAAACRDKLAPHMHPRLYEFVDAIPTTATGKQSRTAFDGS